MSLCCYCQLYARKGLGGWGVKFNSKTDKAMKSQGCLQTSIRAWLVHPMQAAGATLYEVGTYMRPIKKAASTISAAINDWVIR